MTQQPTASQLAGSEPPSAWALANFAFIPYYPVWSLVVITLDVFVIWALTAHGRDVVR